MIYFIKSSDGLIKIGTTTRLSVRLKQIAAQYQCEISLLAVIDGPASEERKLHRRFRHLRFSGEWFNPEDDLLDYIAEYGQTWDGTDEVPIVLKTSTIAIDKRLATLIQRIASGRGFSMTEYVNRRFGPLIEKDYRKLLDEALKEDLDVA